MSQLMEITGFLSLCVRLRCSGIAEQSLITLDVTATVLKAVW